MFLMYAELELAKKCEDGDLCPLLFVLACSNSYKRVPH